MAQVSYGTITITDTNDIERIYMEYAQSSSNSTAPTTGWSEDIPTWEQGKYIWQRTVIKKEGVALSSDSYGEPVCLTGSTGSTGATGRGVSSIVTSYCNYGTGTPAANYSGWSSTVPIYDSTKPNYWIKTVITYTTGTPATDTKIYQDNGITSATTTAASAKTQAAAAEDKADTAISTANTANTNASNALNIANGVNQHFWWIAEDTSTTGGTIPAGAYITDITQSTFKSNPGSYGNLLLRSDGVYLNLGLQTLASFKSNALTFYNSAGTELGKFGSTGLDMSGSLNVRGGGYIGQDTTNRWEFGDNRSYKDTDSAYLLGKGNASIQLGETGHWRLDRNRIHTGWYQLSDTTRGVLHFDTGIDATDGSGTNTYYWDYGLNFPGKATDSVKNESNKFVYIRRSTNTTSTSLATMKGRVDDDDYWTYKFYIDGNGNVHAPGFFIGESATPIGGGTGTVAEKLLNGAGSSTRPVYVRSDTVDGVNHTGEVAPVSWDVNSSISSNNTTNDSNIATIGAIKTYVTGQGYVTSSGVTSVRIQATSPVQSSVSTAQTSTLNTIISLADGYGDTKNPYASKTKNYVLAAPSNANGAPSFRLLTASDIPDLSSLYLTSYTETDPTVPSWAKASTKPSYALSEITSADDIKAIEALTGTSGLLKKTAANTWTLDTNSYITGITSSMVTTALGYTPYNSTNPNGYITASHTSTYNLPIAKYNVLGGVKPAYNSTNAVTLTTTAAANTNAPTIAAKTTTAGRYYAIEIDKNGVLFVNVPWTNVNSSYLTGITSNDVTTALGYTPYNSTNPNGYTTNTGTVTSVRVQASSPLQSSTSTASSTTLNTTISFINQDANKVLAGPSSGNAAAPTFRKLVAADIPNLSWNKITSDKPTTLSGYGITDAAGLTAITGVEISDAQLTITRANGTSTTTDVTITASQATGATKLINSQGQDAAAGSETLPVYFTGGYPQAITSIAKLNGATTTYPEFYAPTSAGTSGYVLKSNGSGAPTWIPQSDISSGNTYTTTIATDTGTNQLTLAHGTKYKLTAGGTDFIFTMPTDTDEKLKVAAVTSGTTYYPIVGTGATAATRQYDTTGFVYVGTNGTANGSNGNALLTLGNSTASTTANWKKGTVRLYGTTAYYIDIISGAPSGNRTITLPNKTGTVALTSDIPTVPTTTQSATTGVAIADHGTTLVGSASNWSAGTASSWVFEDKTVATAAASATSIPNVTSVGTASTWSFTNVTVPIRADSDTTVPKAASSATACDDITAWSAGDGSATLTFTINGSDENQLDISFSHTHTAPSLSYTARSITGVSGSVTVRGVKTGDSSTTTASKASGANSTTPTLGTAISITGVSGTTTVSSKKSGSNSTVPSLTITSTTVVNGKSHTITDNGHTHTI